MEKIHEDSRTSASGANESDTCVIELLIVIKFSGKLRGCSGEWSVRGSGEEKGVREVERGRCRVTEKENLRDK